ncbi:hypothetical protein ElyMa_003418300 [Elysia marginata]|uniref:Dynein light chain n=1 Tax=Elysia marginata TaxID=1093978 RepID=A0AAV4JP22_9GAST|nr:hypothetical protein ElyMa_003418300 [Elysia marginata]
MVEKSGLLEVKAGQESVDKDEAALLEAAEYGRERPRARTQPVREAEEVVCVCDIKYLRPVPNQMEQIVIRVLTSAFETAAATELGPKRVFFLFVGVGGGALNAACRGNGGKKS